MKHRITAAAASLLALTAACGSSDGGSGFGEQQPEGTGAPGGESAGAAGGFGAGSGSGGAATSDPSSLNECATAAAGATLKPANLVVMYDRSGSMATDTKGKNVRAQKWEPVGAAMKDFFGDSGSKGLSASLTFFPNPTSNTIQVTCTPDSYDSPKVALQALPSAAFATVLDATSPGGGTPTTDAMKGAIRHAKDVVAQKAGENVVIVLVTDGLPGVYINGGQEVCTPNTVTTAATEASGALSGTPAIPTYVIGVADPENPTGLTNLTEIAKAGGTTKATIVDTSDPTKTKADFGAALAQIRRAALSCDFAVPPPPNGEKIDFDAVNVTLTKDAGADLLSYSKDCANGRGWHYDDPAQPTRIILCEGACDDAKSATKIDIVFGCATNGATGPR